MTKITYDVYDLYGNYRYLETVTVDLSSPQGSYLWDRLSSTQTPLAIPELGIVVTKIETGL